MRIIPIARPPGEIAVETQKAHASSMRNWDAIMQKHAWLESVGPEAQEICRSKAPVGQRYRQLLALADRVCEAITPLSACREGCSHCCHMPVPISGTEANWIGKRIDVKPHPVPHRPLDTVRQMRDTLVGVPCTFLRQGKCSIYAYRPLPCRMHFNLADTSYMCRTDIPPEQTWVPAPSFDQLNSAVIEMIGGETQGDIRELFRPR